MLGKKNKQNGSAPKPKFSWMPREREARGSSVIASLASILLLQGFQTMKVVAINCDTTFFPVHAFCGLKSMTTLFFESKSYIVQRGVLVGWFKLE